MGMDKAMTRAELRQALEIRIEDLDECLMGQAELFLQAAEAYAVAVSERDALKMKLEEEEAAASEGLRVEHARRNSLEKAKGERLTDTAVSQKVMLKPEIADLQERVLKAKATAEKWLAMKEAYQQRSFMLRELTARQLARMGDLAVERGSVGNRQKLLEGRVQRNLAMASEQRRGRS